MIIILVQISQYLLGRLFEAFNAAFVGAGSFWSQINPRLFISCFYHILFWKLSNTESSTFSQLCQKTLNGNINFLIKRMFFHFLSFSFSHGFLLLLSCINSLHMPLPPSTFLFVFNLLSINHFFPAESPFLVLCVFSSLLSLCPPQDQGSFCSRGASWTLQTG